MSEIQKPPIIADLGEGITMTFLHIPAGRFRMGQRSGVADEEPVTEVEVPEFWMGETPVTQEQYRVMAEACLAELSAIEGNRGSEPSDFKDREDSPQRPVEMVNWHEARVVASWLMGKMREAGTLPPGYVVDLPPEALWEYACRAGTETEYWNGDGEAALAEVGWFDDNSSDETHPVGEKERPNLWGLHDMHGNVWEWCADVYDAKACRKRIDGWTAAVWTEKDAGEDAEYWSDQDRKKGNRNRVLRGGSWYNSAWYCRSAFRNWNRPVHRDWFFGFRLCVFPGSGDPGAGGRTGSGVRKRSQGKEGRRSRGGA